MSTEVAILESWSILNDYGYNRGELLAAARAVYRTAQYVGEPTTQEMEPLLIEALLVSGVFKTICASKRHANPALYPVFARALARHMLQSEWDVIITNR
jgi:hypothetical protein